MPAEEKQVRLTLKPGILALCLALLALTGGAVTIRSYQHSFYPPQAPATTGISDESPFLCGQTAADPTTYESQQVFQEIMTSVAGLPRKETIDLALLALALDDSSWAGEFREALLGEAERGLFTGPANSLKSIQYEAAMRAYFYVKTHQAFPDLFSAGDREIRSGSGLLPLTGGLYRSWGDATVCSQGLERVRQHFGVGQMVDRYRDLYVRLLSARNPR